MKSKRARQNGLENERRVLKSAHEFCEGSPERKRAEWIWTVSMESGKSRANGRGIFWVPREKKWEQWR